MRFKIARSVRLMAMAIAMGVGCSNVIAATTTDIKVIAVPGGNYSYQAAGEFLDNGRPVDAPKISTTLADGWVIMQRQVSQAEYAQCVAEQACKRLDKAFRKNNSPDLPAVGVNWQDANDYAKWLSERTGQQWQLPDYELWVRAAADKYVEDGTLPSDPNDPAVRWLAEYERETARARGRVKPAQRFGSFGKNKLGLLDMGGNVWEWTNTCFTSFKAKPLPIKIKENCGVKILAGAHVAAMPDFIRDPKNGACSIGLPPANLGFRLVRKL